MALATTIWRRPFVYGTGGTLAITVAHVGLLYCSRPVDELLRSEVLLALLVPLPLGKALHDMFMDGRTTGVVVGVLGCCGLAAAAIAAA